MNVLYVWMLITTYYCADQDARYEDATRACRDSAWSVLIPVSKRAPIRTPVRA